MINVFRDSNESSPTRGRYMSYGTLQGSTSPILNSRHSSAASRVMERLNIEKADGGAGITIGKVRVSHMDLCKLEVILPILRETPISRNILSTRTNYPL